MGTRSVVEYRPVSVFWARQPRSSVDQVASLFLGGVGPIISGSWFVIRSNRIENRQLVVTGYIVNMIAAAWRHTTRRLTDEERVGLRFVLGHCLWHWRKNCLMVSAQVLGSIVEIGSITIIAVAVAVLSDEINLADRLLDVSGALTGISSAIAPLSAYILFVGLILSAVLLQIVKSGFGWVARRVRIKTIRLADQAVVAVVVRGSMRMPYSEAAKDSPGFTFQLIEQGRALNSEIIGGVIGNSITTIFVLAMFFFAMTMVSLELTAVALLLILGLSFALSGVTKRLKLLARGVNQKRLEVAQVVVEYLGAHRILRIFSREAWGERKIEQHYRELLLLDHRVQVVDSTIDPAIQISSISGIGLFLIGGVAVLGQSGEFLLPKLLMFVILLHRGLQHARPLINIRVSLGRAQALAGSLGKFLRRMPTEKLSHADKRTDRQIRKSMRFENASFKYPGATVYALSNIDLTILNGETVALVGPSGAGKSTLIDLLIGLYRPTEGRLVIDEIDVARSGKPDWRESIGVVDQTTFLLDASIAENIQFGREEYGQKEIEQAAKIAHAYEFIVKLKDKFDTQIGREGFRLSGGQKQRLAIARALLADPSVLILDEATSALDSETEELVQKTMREVRHERTVIMIAHRLSTLHHADKIAVLEGGRLIEFDSPAKLIEMKGRFAALWSSQQRKLSN
jgi:ATP-binding cassette, subfamily B, bacterial MsbA